MNFLRHKTYKRTKDLGGVGVQIIPYFPISCHLCLEGVITNKPAIRPASIADENPGENGRKARSTPWPGCRGRRPPYTPPGGPLRPSTTPGGISPSSRGSEPQILGQRCQGQRGEHCWLVEGNNGLHLSHLCNRQGLRENMEEESSEGFKERGGSWAI